MLFISYNNDIFLYLNLQIAQLLYTPYIEKIPLFKGCSSEFINQIVVRLHEEYFFPGEVITEQGSVVDHLYFVCEGSLVRNIYHCVFVVSSFRLSSHMCTYIFVGGSCYRNRWNRRACDVA